MSQRTHSSRRVADLSFIVLAVVGFFMVATIAALTFRGVVALGTSVQSTPCGCSTAIASTQSPWLPLTFVLLGTGLLATFVARTILVARRTKQIVRQVRVVATSSRLAIMSRKLGVEKFVREVQASATDIFCAGLIHPNIYVSQAALEKLNNAELQAVLNHESYHLQHRDPLRLLIADVVAFPFRLIPGFSNMAHEFRTRIELAADEQAVAVSGNIHALSTALLAFARPSRPETLQLVSFIGVTEQRIDQLLGRRNWWQSLRFFAAMGILAGAFLLAAGTVNARVTTFETQVGSMSAGLCKQAQVHSCIAPPRYSPFQRSSVRFMSVQ